MSNIGYYFKTTASVFFSYFKGQLLVILILCVLYAAALWLVGIKFGILIGIVVGLLSIVPYLGFTVGLIISVIVAVIQFWSNDTIVHVLLVLLAFAVVQLLESFLITPAIMGKSVGVNPFILLGILILGGMAFGPIGMMFAVPCAAVLIKIYKDKIKYTHSELVELPPKASEGVDNSESEGK